jgi:hypothetical protein
MVHKDELTDEFDEVKVCKDYIERERKENDMWKEIEDFFDANEIVDKIHYSEIEDLKFQPESAYPLIKIKTKGEWRKLPLEDEEQAEKVFKRLRYRYQSYLQNN